MNEHPNSPERVLRRLGITEPGEIDVEAIAWDLGATVKYRRLVSCEARIVGTADKAVITVNSASQPRRQRFSVAHEIGHWVHHRHRVLTCQKADIGVSSLILNPERIADGYARDLLMPDYLFKPIARAAHQMSFQTVRGIADQFDTSLTATAIRLVEGKFFTAILVCHDLRGRRWFTRSPEVPDRWFPASELSADSFAFEVLHGGNEDDKFPRKMGAGAWFDRYDADRFDIREQTIRVGEHEILTLLLIEDSDMLV
jgi:Zn-dependent peptidase ImmA (M78 family)